jgi:hypothetical protein
MKCEDSTAYRRRRGWSIAVLADGAGSRSGSAKGARIVTQRFVALFPSMLRMAAFNRSDFRNGMFGARLSKIIIDELQKSLKQGAGDKIGNYASTLLFAVWHENVQRWLVGHLGDGAIAAIDAAGRLHTLSQPDNGEFVNETFFITDDGAENRLRLYVLKGAAGISMMSDGSTGTFYSTFYKRFASGVARFFNWQHENGEQNISRVLRRNLELLALPRSNDDCSIVLIQLSEPVCRPYHVYALHNKAERA